MSELPFDIIFGRSDDEEEDEEEEPEEKPFTCPLDQALRVERMDLMRNHQKHKAKELEEGQKAIFTILEGAQERLCGCNTIAPVRAFLRERIKATAPFAYLPGVRPLTQEQWEFIENNQSSLLRILHNTFNPYGYPGLLMLNAYLEIFTKLHTELAQEMRAKAVQDTWKSLRAELGTDDQKVESFVKNHPSAEMNDRRLRSRLEEMAGGDEITRDLVASLPKGFMACSVQSLAAEQFQEVNINASRENSPVRAENNQEMDVEDDDEEMPLELFFPPIKPRSEPVSKPLRSILRTRKTWHRSDGEPVRFLPVYGIMAYSEYSATKKKVSFKSIRPTECRVYYINRMERHNKGIKESMIPRNGLTWGFKTDYKTYQQEKRYPVMKVGPPCSAHSKRSDPKRIRALMASTKESDKLLAEQIIEQFPTLFLRKRPLRYSGGDGRDERTIPAHPHKREKDLGELAPVIAEGVLNEFYSKMMSFGELGHGATTGRQFHPHNCVNGILILTDGILEDVNPATLLNAALFALPPPFESRDAVDILINCREVTDGIHDVILSWGFEQLVEERDAVEAFASLVMFALEVKTVLEENVKKIAEERAKWDQVAVPKMWLFTIPDVGYPDDDLYKQYNTLIREFCKDDPDFHLIDWAGFWSNAPPHFHSIEDPHKSEYSLMVFFRLCRFEMELLYRRPMNERKEEHHSQGSLGTGPWLKDIYSLFEKKTEVQKPPQRNRQMPH